MDESARRLRDGLRRLLVAHGALEPTRRPCGTPLSLPHAHALLTLRARGPMSVSGLAAELSIDRTNVSRLCRRMEAAGELARAPDLEDGRARRLELTPLGERVARNVDHASVAHFDAVVARLGDDAEAVVAALDRLSVALAGPQEHHE